MNSPIANSHFAADLQDIIGTTNTGIDFQMTMGSSTLLDEHYDYDAQYQVAIRGLAAVASAALYGQLEPGAQPYATSQFDFLLNGASACGGPQTIMSMRMPNLNDPDGEKMVLKVATRDVCHAGWPYYVSVRGRRQVALFDAAGQTVATKLIGSTVNSYTLMTVDCDPTLLFPEDYQKGALLAIDDELRVDVVHATCQEAVAVRFLNRYDMPETLVARELSEKPSATDNRATMYGRQTRFSVASGTEYTLRGFPIRHQEQWDVWQDLLTARRAQIRWQGHWHEIIIGKASHTRRRLPFYAEQPQVAFVMADARAVL